MASKGEGVLPIFVVLLAALGAAFFFRGRPLRGFLVLTAAHATGVAVTAAYGRWNWMAFFIAMTAICLFGIAVSRRSE